MSVLPRMLWFCLSSCLVAAAAEGPPPDYDAGSFVRGLARIGYTDLAELQLKRFETDPNLPEAQKASLATARGEIALARADRLQGEERLEVLSNAFSAAQLYAVQKQGTKEGAAAQDVLDALATKLSESYVQAVEQEDNPTKAAARREEATQFLTKEFNRNDEEYRELEKKDPRTPDEDVAMMNKAYSLPRILLQQSRLLDSKAPEKPVKLKDAIAELEKFQLNFGSVVMSYQALTLLGLTYKELATTHQALGQNDDAKKAFDDALSAFGDAIALKDSYVDDNGNLSLDEIARDIIASATMEKVKLLRDLQRYPDAIQAVDDLMTWAPELKTERAGLSAQLLKLESLRDMGKNDDALQLANRISEADRGGAIGGRAQAILSEMIAGGSTKVGGDMLAKAGDRAFKNGNYAEAFAIYRKAVRVAGDAKARAKLLLQMGLCQSQIGNLEEAAVAYEASSALSTSDESADAAYNAALVYSKLSGKSKLPFYRKRYDTALRDLSSRFGSNPRASNAQYLVAANLESEGKLQDAASAYLLVSEKATRYELALYQAGDCYVQISADAKTKPEDKQSALLNAEKALNQCLGKLRDRRKAAGDKLDENLLNVDYGARKLLARIYLATKPPRVAEVNQLLESVDKDFAGDPVKIAGAKVLAVQAMIFDGKLGDAITLLGELMQRAPKDSGVVETSRNLAAALDTALDANKWNDAKVSVDAARLACAQCYRHFAVQQAADPKDRRRVEEAGDRIYFMALKIAGIPEKDESFARIKPYRVVNTAPFEWAIDAYTAAEENETDADKKLQLNLRIGRAAGLIRRFDLVQQAYSAVFTDEPVFNPLTRGLDQTAVQRRPLLVAILLENAYANIQLATGTATKSLCDQAVDWLRAVNPAVKPAGAGKSGADADDSLFWVARTLLIEGMIKRGQSGDYQAAERLLNDTRRNYPELDGGKHGAQEKIAALEKELGKLLGRPK
ncbi:MAG: hypothetical protein U1E76_26255 [Planctomycetota bacterium]